MCGWAWRHAAKPEVDVQPMIVPHGTVDDVQPVTDRTATGKPRRLKPDRAEL